jgi:hypothetical protein
MKSQLEQKFKKPPVLTVWYDPIKKDWDQRIKEAVEQHGLGRGVVVIARPEETEGR